MPKVQVAKASDVPDGEMIKVMVGSDPIALFKVDGKIYATTNICTHEECELDENHMMHGDVVECTCHGSQFDIKTGAVVLPPAAEPLKTYQVSVDGEDIYVEG